MTKLESHDLQYAPAPIVQNTLPGLPGKSWAEVLYSQRCMAMFRAGIIPALFPEQEAKFQNYKAICPRPLTRTCWTGTQGF